MLRSTPNRFGGTEVETDTLPSDPKQFHDQLDSAIDQWRTEQVKVAWLRIPTHKAGLIPVAVDAGFVFHHADSAGVQMTLQIKPNAYVPPFATHYVGAGGVVVWEDKLLVVSERYRRRSGGRHYKLPGGALYPGEHISKAVVREIREETGIETRFQRLICFRHWHGYRHDKSDIYFVCRLAPLTFEISRQEEEIDACLWMPVEEYLSHENVHLFNRKVVRAALGSGGILSETIEGYGTPETHEFFLPPEH